LVTTQGLGIFFITTTTQEIASNDASFNAITRIYGSRIVGISSDSFRLYSRNGKISQSYNLKSTNNPDFMFLSQSVPLMVFNDGTWIHSYDLSLGTELWRARPSGTLSSLAMTPSGSFVVAGTENGNILRYNDKGNLTWSYSSGKADSPMEAISQLAVSKDGGLVAAATREGNVLLLNMRGTLLGSYRLQEPIRSIALSQDGSILLVASDTNLYAFITGYTATPGTSATVSKTPAPGSQNTTGKNVTPYQDLTRRPVIPSWTKASTPAAITAIPTEYSIIRTPTQSPVGIWSGFLALMAGIALYGARRR
jgi:WD40 repeat protein